MHPRAALHTLAWGVVVASGSHRLRARVQSALRPELQRAGIDDADLADVAGHTLETMRAHYTHLLRQSFDAIRSAIG